METQERELPKFKFIAGVGNYEEGKACIISACVAKWRFEHNEPLGTATDQLDCISPCIRRYAINLNDANWWESDEERTEVLYPFIDKLIGTNDPEKEEMRKYMCADRAVHVFAPFWLENSKNPEVSKWGAILRALPKIIDKVTALICRDKTREARSAAADDDAAYAADADAYAAAAAAAAADDAAADDAAYAADAAAYAAAADADDAAAYAADAAALKEPRKIMRAEAIKLLEDLIAI